MGKKKTQSEIIKEFEEVHGNCYDYSKVVYKGIFIEVTIYCKKHGSFKRTPNSHKLGKGCPFCLKDYNSKIKQSIGDYWNHLQWLRIAQESKNFDSFKVYIIRCWNEEEEFYKIGKTFKTVKERFKNNYLMPYNYEVILEEVFENSELASLKEVELQSNNNLNIYIPKSKFKGMYECYSIINFLCNKK